MNLLNRFLANGLAKSAPVIGSTPMTRGAVIVYGIYNQTAEIFSADFGGVNIERTTTFLINNDDLNGTVFARGQRWIIEGEELTIDKITNSAVTTILELINPNAK